MSRRTYYASVENGKLEILDLDEVRWFFPLTDGGADNCLRYLRSNGAANRLMCASSVDHADEEGAPEGWEFGAWLEAASDRFENSDEPQLYKYTIVYEFLSEKPFADPDLVAIAEECSENGKLVGRFVDAGCTRLRLSGIEMAKELVEFGSEPGLFKLNAKGEKVD